MRCGLWLDLCARLLSAVVTGGIGRQNSKDPENSPVLAWKFISIIVIVPSYLEVLTV